MSYIVVVMMYYGPGNGFDLGWAIFSGFLWLLFFFLLIYIGVRLLRKRGDSSFSYRETNPLDIAKERYAKGEINKEQYDQLIKDLKQKH